ncbi:hypothetical protein Tco_0174983 [Tanacetum coccineum]
MLLNVDQLQKQLDKDEFQEVGSMEAFWVVDNQFQKFINSQFTLDYDSQMTDKYFVEYTRIEYDRRVNKRQMHTQESKIDTGKAIDDALVVTESSGTESEVQGQQHTEQPEFINEGRVDQYPKQCQVKSHMLDSSPDSQITEYLKQSLESENILLKKAVAQFQKDFSRMEAHLTQHYLPKRRESIFAKPNHMIASSESRDSSQNMPRFSSNDMVHNHYLDEARKKKQERDRNSKTSVMPSARFQSTVDGSKTKPRSTNHSTRSLPVSKSSCVTITVVPKADHSKSSMIELESLFGHLFDEYFNGVNQVVSKSSVVTTADASVKRQQQPDSTSSTSTLATTVTTDGNFDLQGRQRSIILGARTRFEDEKEGREEEDNKDDSTSGYAGTELAVIEGTELAAPSFTELVVIKGTELAAPSFTELAVPSFTGLAIALHQPNEQFLEVTKFAVYVLNTLQDFGTMPIFKRTFAQDLDLLEQHLTKEIISQTECKTILTKLRTTFENDFNSEFKERMQKYTRFDAQSFKDAMICNMDSIGKYMLEIILYQQRTPQLLKQKKLMQTQEDHSNPIQALNIDSLKVDLVVIQNTCSEKEDTNSETASSKSVKESSLDKLSTLQR